MPTLVDPYRKRTTGTWNHMADGSQFGGGTVDPTFPTISAISGDQFRASFGTRVFPSYSGGTGGQLVSSTVAKAYLTDLNPGMVTHKMSPDVGQNIVNWTKDLWTNYGIKSVWTIGEPFTAFSAADWTDVKAKIVDAGDALYMVNGQNEINNVRGTAVNRAVTSKSLTNNVATLTLTGTIPASPGQGIKVTNVDATFNGTYTITAKSGQTISYRKVAANVPQTAVPAAASPNAQLPVLPPDWDTQAANHQSALWDVMNTGSSSVNVVRVAAGKSRILVANPNLWSGDNTIHDRDAATLMPQVKGKCDAINYHLYPRGGDPNYFLDDYVATYRSLLEVDPTHPVLPIICSEAGYFVADNYNGAAKVVTHWAHDIYIRKLLLEYAVRGFKVSQFEFLNDPDPTQAAREAAFGFFEMDAVTPASAWTKRVVYNKMKAYMALTGGSAGTVQAEITTTSTADFKYLAVKHSGGTKLFLWRPVDIERNRTAIALSPATVTVSVRTPNGTQTATIGADVAELNI